MTTNAGTSRPKLVGVGACGFGRNVHGGFVGFQCNQGVIYGDSIARFDFHSDDVYIFVPADVGDFQFD